VVYVQVSDFDFADKTSLRADELTARRPDDDAYLDDEDRALGVDTDHDYGSGTPLPDPDGRLPRLQRSE